LSSVSRNFLTTGGSGPRLSITMTATGQRGSYRRAKDCAPYLGNFITGECGRVQPLPSQRLCGFG